MRRIKTTIVSTPISATAFFERLVNYYRLEWGHEGPPADPKAPPARRKGWQDAPETIAAYPFTEWPYGGATNHRRVAAKFGGQSIDERARQHRRRKVR